MRKKIQLLWGYRWIFRSLFKTIYLNFKCLPFRQALFLPIILYKPRLLTLSGKINIEAAKIRSGMIQLGRNEVSFYPNSGITIENEGTIVFKGNAKIASGSCLSVKKNAVLTIGDNFHATAELKVACYCSTTIGDNVLVGWETKIFDTDFHQLTSVDKSKILQAFGPITIGNNVWIANDCLVMKNTNIPDFCVVGARSLLMKNYDVPPYSMIVGNPANLKKTGCFLDRHNMQITY
jgi:acetyltransferase-like isoleucine patch superfamily enzyme